MAKGQKVISIDWERAEKLYKAGASSETVAAALGISPDTMYRRCVKENGCTLPDFAAKSRSRGDAMLLESMFESATTNDNVTMQMFLAKNRLGYADKVETKQEITMANEIELRIEAPAD